MPLQLPFRQIHLDFHTSPLIPDVASKWDAAAFGDRLAEARVNSVTLFAKCHHGHLYTNTKRPERHPTLPRGLDLLGEQIEACRKRDIQTPIYVSVLWDEYAGSTHPEWLAIKPDGARHGRAPLSGQWGWQTMDMNSPYADFLADQMHDIFKLHKPEHGVFMDITFDVDSIGKYSLDAMAAAGVDPTDDKARAAFQRKTVHNYMARYNAIISQYLRGKPVKVWYNSRPKICLPEEKQYLQHVEIEALPTGGWGYTYYPLNVRFARNFGLPHLGMTGRFHRSWADFGGLKPQAALMYECCQMLAHGGQCSVGDQLHPRGTLDAGAYQLIGSVYRHVEACEPFCRDASPVTEVAVIRQIDGEYHVKPGDTLEGVVRCLQQLRQQFDFVPPQSNFKPYKLLILPENVTVDAKLAAALKKYVKQGGKLLLVGHASLTAEGKPVLAEAGIAAHGESPFAVTYMRFDKAAGASLLPSDHVMYERSHRITPSKGAKALVRVVEPYFDRAWNHFCSHAQTPTDKLSRFAGLVLNKAGTIATIAYPAFKAYGTWGNLPARELLHVAIEKLLPQPLLRADGPSFLETSILKQDRRHVVHLLSYCPQRRTPTIDIVEEPTVVHDLTLSLRLDREPKQAFTAPADQPLELQWHDGYATVTVPRVEGHTMVVFE